MAELIYGKPIDSQRLAEDTRLTEQFVKEVMSAYREAGERKQAAGLRRDAEVVQLAGRIGRGKAGHGDP